MTDTIESTDQGMTDAASDVHVNPDVSYEDLSAALEEAQNAEREDAQSSDPSSENQEEEESETEDTATADPNKQTASQESPPSREEFNKLQRQQQGQEILLKRRTSELGEVKKQLQRLVETLEPGVKEKFLDDPQSAAQDVVKIESAKTQIQEIEKEEIVLQARSEASRVISSHIPAEEFSVDDMAESLARDGLAPEMIESFKRDPLSFSGYNPVNLIQLHRRAKAETLLVKVLEAAKGWKAKYEESQKNAGKNVLKRVDAVARQIPTVTGGASSSSGNRPLTDADILKLSDADLDRLLASSR